MTFKKNIWTETLGFILFFDIIAIFIWMFSVTWNKMPDSRFIKFCGLLCKKEKKKKHRTLSWTFANVAYIFLTRHVLRQGRRESLITQGLENGLDEKIFPIWNFSGISCQIRSMRVHYPKEQFLLTISLFV